MRGRWWIRNWKMSNETLVRCDRCGANGAKVRYGWVLLCQVCYGEDMKEYADTDREL